MSNKLPEQYVNDLFSFIADGQPLVAQVNGLPYSTENAYQTGVEIAAIGLMFATMEREGVTPEKEALVNDIWERFEAWGQKVAQAKAEQATQPPAHECDDDGCTGLH